MTRAKPFWLARIAVLALAVSVFAACEDDTGPTLSDTGDQVSSVISQFLVQNEGLQTLKIFGSDISALMASIAPVSPVLSPGSRTITGLTRAIRASLAELRDAGPMAIPPEYLGTTFIYDPGQGWYVPSDREGAPELGVRFILYDNKTDLNQIGYLDFVEQSNFEVTPWVIDIELEVVLTDVGTVLLYTVDGTATETSGYLAFDGYLSDGVDELGFEFNLAGDDESGWEADFTLTFRQLSVTVDLSEQPSGVQTLAITVEDLENDNSIVFDFIVDATGEVQEGSGITVNGEQVAIISGNVEQDTVEITNVSGDPLTREDLAALAEIFAGLAQAFMVMGELLGFGIGLVGLVIFF